MTSILRPWVETLTLQQQGTLLCAIRGPDGEAKEAATKSVIRALRACVLKNARNLSNSDNSDKFLGDGSGVTSGMLRLCIGSRIFFMQQR